MTLEISWRILLLYRVWPYTGHYVVDANERFEEYLQVSSDSPLFFHTVPMEKTKVATAELRRELSCRQYSVL